jgi:ATP dependent DNA ligase domain
MTDARTVLASLRPQAFGTGRPDRVLDPIVEPLWAGIRALAAVDAAGAVLADETGAPIENQPEIISALAAAGPGPGLVLDGFLTKLAAQDGTGVYLHTDTVPNIQSSVGHFFLGSRRNRAAEAAEARAELRRASTFEEDDVVSYVAFDLLWLDGESLLDVPLLERRRLLDTILEESDLVRRGTFVRPPIGGWIRSWRAQGFVGLTFRAANSRYEPGVASTEWATTPMPR